VWKVWAIITKEDQMPLKRYVIERDIVGVGAMSEDELSGASATSNDALIQVGPDVQWSHSYVAGDKTFCVYYANNENAIREHAKVSGFPATIITEIQTIIGPSTAV
jgi:hypothetical protein